MRVIDAHRPVVARHFAKRDDEHESSQWCGRETAPRRTQSAGRSMRWGIASDHGTGRRIWGEPQIWAWLSFDRSQVTRASAYRPRKPAVLNLVGSNWEGLERPVRDKREALEALQFEPVHVSLARQQLLGRLADPLSATTAQEHAGGRAGLPGAVRTGCRRPGPGQGGRHLGPYR